MLKQMYVMETSCGFLTKAENIIYLVQQLKFKKVKQNVISEYSYSCNMLLKSIMVFIP